MGAGGTGGWLGARLALSGLDVGFIARGDHLSALRHDGLRVSGADSLYLPQVFATDKPAEIGIVDVIFFCVKIYDTESAARMLSPLIGPRTFLVTVQNGVESATNISRIIGGGRTLSGAAYFPANVAAPGKINFVGRNQSKPHIAFGEPGGGASNRAVELARLCRVAGIDTDVFDNTESLIWEKFCLVASTSATTALTRQCFGAVTTDPDMRWLLIQTIAEAARVGRKIGVTLADDLEKRVLVYIDQSPPAVKASQLVDLEHGRRLELEGLSGTVVRLGVQTGTPTPVHKTVYAALKPFVDGVR